MAVPCLGDWVDFESLDSSDMLTGYIVAVIDGRRIFKVCVPRNQRTYTVRLRDLHVSPVGLRIGDTQALIDLSLQTRDEKWFQELVNWIPENPAKKHITFLCIFVPLASLLVLLA